MSEKIEVCFFCGKSFNKFPANYKKVASYADNGGFFHNGCYLDACKNDPNKASAVIRYGKNWEEALKYALKNRKKREADKAKAKGEK